jgi:hypothetical protein
MSDSTLPTVVTPAGLVPQTATALNAQLISYAQGIQPDVTVNLPGTLIEDLGSTGTGALLVMESGRIETIFSINPLAANPAMLYNLGQIYGVPVGVGSNASVYVVFSGPTGFVIQAGLIVSDGTNQYSVVDGGIIGSSGASEPLFCLCTNQNQFAIPANTVNQIVTSIPSQYNVTCNNPLIGTPLTAQQTIPQYRAQVMQAGIVTSVGTPAFLKTLLGNVPGVNPGLISIQTQSGGWKVIVGGSGDPFQIANAIFQGVGDISRLVGSVMEVSSFTEANPGVVTTNIDHGFSTGQVITVAGATPSAYNGSYTITVLSPTTFSVGVNTTSFGTYGSGGVVTPNFRNEVVTITSFPDTYQIPYVISPDQTVTMTVTWQSISPTVVSPSSVAALASVAIAAYINSLGIGQPINVDMMVATFQTAVSSLVNPALLSEINFNVDIDGVATTPEAGTVLIYGDPESYMTATSTGIVVEQA